MQVDIKRSMEAGEKRFNQLSVEERGKFDEETLVNVNNIRKQSSMCLRASGFSNEYIVVKTPNLVLLQIVPSKLLMETTGCVHNINLTCGL